MIKSSYEEQKLEVPLFGEMFAWGSFLPNATIKEFMTLFYCRVLTFCGIIITLTKTGELKK